MPTASARATLPLLVIGGGLVGMTVAGYLYGDEQLKRLHESHKQDRELSIES